MDNKEMTEKIILSFLMHTPSLLFDDKYPIKAKDFSKKVYKQMYSAMLNLYARGNTDIQPQEVIMQIGKSASAFKEFQEARGEGLLNEINNLNYNAYDYDIQYSNLKKYSLFQDLRDSGIEISDLYNPLAEPDKAMAMADKIDNMSYKEIIDHYREKIAKIEDRYENFIEKVE